MNKIQILSQEVINKIAAGEVIERPSSIVKELIENSIDAQATNIEIIFEQSGKNLIEVIDNGTGMSKQDLSLSIKRHATSKINDFNDLFNLSTFGFRGEALPSICSVSKLTIITKQPEDIHGWELYSEGGEIIYIKESGAKNGTSVIVKDIFYNTPARKKFLKSDYTERSHIIRVIEELSISNYKIGFTVKSDNKIVLNSSPANKIDERIIDILGQHMYDDLTYFESDYDFLKTKGFLSKIGVSYPNNNIQYLFVNKRPVSNRMLIQIVYDIYRDSLEINRHPAFIIMLDINPAILDVNVHPTKRLVKFSQEKEITELLKHSLRNCITKQSIPVFKLEQAHYINEKNTREYTPDMFQTSKNKSYQISSAGLVEALKKISQDSKKEFNLENVQVIGQLYNTYILCQTSTGLLIIDQHAANERILYEKFLAKRNNLNQQRLLFTQIIQLTPHESTVLKNFLDILNELGFEIREFGINTFAIYSYPEILGEIGNINDFIKNFINILTEDTSQKPVLEKHETIIKSACRAAVKAHDKISNEEMISLIQELNNCSQPLCCPHGRPTMVYITIDEIAKKFKRQ